MRLSESFRNLWTEKEKLEWIDEIVPLVLNSYEKVGGWKGRKKADSLRTALVQQAGVPGLWKLSINNGVLTALQIQDQVPGLGRKTILTASKGRPGARKVAEIVRANAALMQPMPDHGLRFLALWRSTWSAMDMFGCHLNKPMLSSTSLER